MARNGTHPHMPLDDCNGNTTAWATPAHGPPALPGTTATSAHVRAPATATTKLAHQASFIMEATCSFRKGPFQALLDRAISSKTGLFDRPLY